MPAGKTFDEITQEEYNYVTYAYYASILTGKYEVPVNPVLLEAALASPNRETEVPGLVLKSMLDYVSAPCSEGETNTSLFEKAKKEGFFNLEEEFYTDIYDYILTVNEEYDSIWFTEFLLAEELGGDKNALTVTINGERVTNTLSQRVYISDIPGDKITVKINYNDGLRNEDALYNFTIKRSTEGSDTVAGLSIDFLDPQGIYSNVESLLNNKKMKNEAEEKNEPYSFPDYSSQFETYPETSGSLFETYPTDINGNAGGIEYPLALNSTITEKEPEIITGIIRTVTDNPIIAATGLALSGLSAGFLILSRRKKNTPDDDNEIQ